LTGIALGPALADSFAQPAAGQRPGRAVMPWFRPLLNLIVPVLSIARSGFTKT
jgi:hypothetical protein